MTAVNQLNSLMNIADPLCPNLMNSEDENLNTSSDSDTE